MKRKSTEPEKPQVKLDVNGPTFRFINHLESEARERKEELARMRANFITYLYEHSEPL